MEDKIVEEDRVGDKIEEIQEYLEELRPPNDLPAVPINCVVATLLLGPSGHV